MTNLLHALRGVLVGAALALYVLALGPPLIAYTYLSRNPKTIYKVSRGGARLGLWLAGVRLRVAGLEKINPLQNYLYMANHQSNVDPPVLLVSAHQDLRALAKKELFKLPILGFAMKMVGFVPVDRKDPDAAKKSVDSAAEILRTSRYSFLIFPEGTRSWNGQLLPFKHGVFVLAIKSGVPILPVTVNGSRQVMAKGSPEIRPGTVEVLIHDPIPTSGFSFEDRALLAHRVREIIAADLKL